MAPALPSAAPESAQPNGDPRPTFSFPGAAEQGGGSKESDERETAAPPPHPPAWFWASPRKRLSFLSTSARLLSTTAREYRVRLRKAEAAFRPPPPGEPAQAQQAQRPPLLDAACFGLPFPLLAIGFSILVTGRSGLSFETSRRGGVVGSDNAYLVQWPL